MPDYTVFVGRGYTFSNQHEPKIKSSEAQTKVTDYERPPDLPTLSAEDIKKLLKEVTDYGRLPDLPTLSAKLELLAANVSEEATSGPLDSLQLLKIKLDIKEIYKKELVSENVWDKKASEISYAVFWERLTKTIETVKLRYVDFYADLMAKYAEFFKGWNDIMVKAGASAVTAGKDGNELKFDSDVMYAGHLEYWRLTNSLQSKLPSVPGWSSMPSEQQQSVIASLQPAFKVDASGNLTFDNDSYNKMPECPSYSGTVSTARYQAWLASFNGVGSTYQSNMESFAQRYSQVNSTFDNLNKVLSGMISGLADLAKELFRSL